MLDHDANRCGRQAADEAREPESVEPHGVGRGGKRGRIVYEGGMGRVDGWGIDREAAQLSRDLLEGDDDRISRRWWSEELIRLDVEGGKDCGEQTGLFRYIQVKT